MQNYRRRTTRLEYHIQLPRRRTTGVLAHATQTFMRWLLSFHKFARTSSLHSTLKRDRIVAFFLLILFIAGFLVRVWGMSKYHSWDEMVYLQDGQVICCGKLNYSELDFRPPLLSLIFGGVFLVWHNIWAACVTTALINSLGPVFLFFAAAISVGRLPAVLSSSLLAFSPFFVGIFPDGFNSDGTGDSLLTDSPSLTLIIVAFWLLLSALKRPTASRFFFAGFSLALCILMRFGSLPSVGMLLLLPLASPHRWKALIASLSGLAAGLSPYLLWSRLTFDGFLFTLRSGWKHVEGPIESFDFFIRNAPTIFTPVALSGLLLCFAFELCPSVRVYASVRDRTNLWQSNWPNVSVSIFLWLWLFCTFLFFSMMPHKEPRYILPLTPPLLILAGSGLGLFSALPNRALRIIAAFFLALSLSLTFLPLRERFSGPFVDLTTPDEEIASRFLDALVPATSFLWISFNYPSFAFYTNLRIHELSAVGPELYHQMELIPPGEVLVVYRVAEDPSQSDLVWLDGSHKFIRLREYPSLVIFRRVASCVK
jgi:hypothetical protein